MKPSDTLTCCFFAVLTCLLATQASANTILDLDATGLYLGSVASGINDQGQIVGNTYGGSNRMKAFIWSATNGITLISTPYTNGTATDINNAGTVIGYSWASGTTDYRGFYWNQTDGAVNIGLQPNNINGDNFAQRISSTGQIVGDSYGSGGYLWTEASGYFTMPGIGTEAHSINDIGQVVGSTNTFAPRHAYLWSSGDGMRDLGSLETDGRTISIAQDINNNEWVVGQSDGFSATAHPFLWTEETGMIDLFPSSFNGRGGASAINDNGVVVGWYEASAGRGIFIWTEQTGMIDLMCLLPENPDWDSLYTVGDINDAGQIVGSGIIDGSQHAFLITIDDLSKGYFPGHFTAPEPSILLLLITGLFGLVGLQRKVGLW